MKRSRVWYGLSGIAVLTMAIISGCTRNLTVAPTAPVATATSTVAGPTSTFTRTNTPVFSSTFTATATRTNSPTATASATNTNTSLPGATSTFTSTATDTWTFTPTPTVTASATNTNTNVPGATDTFTPTATSTATMTLTATATATTASCQAASLQSSYSFDSSLECWAIDSGSTTKATSLDISGTHTYSGAGAMHATISNAASTSAQFNLVYATPQDFTGKGISVWIYVDASMTGASVQLYSLSGSGGTWGAGGWTDFTASNVGKWVQVAYTVNVTQVSQIGIQFYNLTASTTGNVYMDNFRIADACSASSVIASYPFDSSVQCWHVDSNSAAVVSDLGISSAQSHTGTGSMYASVATGASTSTVQLDLGYSPFQSLTGMTYSAWVYVPASLAGCSAQLFMQNGNSPWTWVNSPTATSFDGTNAGTWVQLTFTPAWGTSDSNTVGTIGIQFLNVPANAVGTLYVDDVTLTGAATNTPTRTPTPVNTPTETGTPTITLTPTETFTTVPGATDTFTSTVTSTFTATLTPTVTATPTETSAVTSTNTPQPTPTSCNGTFQTEYTFDSSVECWGMDASSATGVSSFGISSAVVTQGTGAVHIGYSEPATAVSMQFEQTFASPTDLSGRTISAWIHVDSNMVGSGVQFFTQSNGWASWSNSTGVYLDASKVGKWVSISWAVSGGDPTLVDQIGIQFYSMPGGKTGDIYLDDIQFSSVATPTNTPNAACTPILLNDCETLTSNGTWGGSNSAFSISPLHATQGSNSLAVSIANPSSWNDQFIQLSGFTPNTWTNTTQLVMDMYVDASVLTGTTYNQMFLEASTGGTPGSGWQYITSNHPSLVAGANSVTFTIDWTASSGTITAASPLDMLVIVLQTGGTSGTGNVYVDNVRLTQSCP